MRALAYAVAAAVGLGTLRAIFSPAPKKAPEPAPAAKLQKTGPTELADYAPDEPYGAKDRMMLIPQDPPAEPVAPPPAPVVAVAVAPPPKLEPFPKGGTSAYANEAAAPAPAEFVRRLEPSRFARPFGSVAPAYADGLSRATSRPARERSTRVRRPAPPPE